MATLRIDTAPVFAPLLAPARYKGAFGGRGSGKSHFFAEKLIEDSMAEPGDCGEGLRSVWGMNDYTADSIKSLEGFKRGWWEEAQTARPHSLKLYRPTLRADGAERWFSWNPRRKTDPVDQLLRGLEQPTGSVVVRANWRDNVFFTDELELERLDTKRTDPDQYDHVWEGDYVSVIDGAYYAASINASKEAGRIGRVEPDPLMSYHLFFDIGGTGARADAVAIWVAQFIGKEIRALNYYEAVGQPLATHLAWMREEGYKPANTQVWLPHDGSTNDKVHDVSYESAFQDAGYDVTVVPNQGRGAAKARVESGRRYFSSIWFNQKTTEAGLDALGWYHERRDEIRGIGLGPEHDWSSHGSDAFGLMCIAAEQVQQEMGRSIKDPYEGMDSGYAA